ncbi:O-antigen ligase family protein [Nostoc sp.]|uniref:O-antigen ligase family protein n=1 Tax=Nostoc sp. TaxID=1180 RepID=UPI002FF46DE3
MANIAGIAIIHFSVISTLSTYKKWSKFIVSLCWFLFCFLILNIAIQLLPISLGEFIFQKVSAYTDNTTNFSYVTLVESIQNFPVFYPAALPTMRNHGMAFLATLSFCICISLLIFPEKIREIGLKKYQVIIFGILCFTCIYFSYSRTSLIAVMMIIFVSAFFTKNKVVLISFVFCISLLIILFLSQEELKTFLIDLFRIDLLEPEKIGGGREKIWELHSQLFALKPITGWGWILPYEEFNYDLTTNPFSESGVSFLLVTQGLLRGSIYISLMILAIVRNLVRGQKFFFHALMCFFSIFLILHFTLQGGLVGATSSIGTLSQVLLAIALYSEPAKIDNLNTKTGSFKP